MPTKPIRGRRNPTDAYHQNKSRGKKTKRTQARRLMKQSLTKKYGKAKAESMMRGKDVNHKVPLSKGGSNSLSNLTLQSPKKNRGSDKAKGPYKRRKGKLK